jgi:hypothetical protein
MLEALHALGTKVITMQINYPLLTERFLEQQGAAGKSAEYLKFYRDTFARARELGVKIAVLHNTLLEGYGRYNPHDYYAALKAEGQAGKTRFGQERAVEALTIITELQPDYFALTTEPTTHSVGLGLNESEWEVYAKGVASLLKALPAERRGATLVGIGTGSWESVLFVRKFAAGRLFRADGSACRDRPRRGQDRPYPHARDLALQNDLQ